MIHWYVITLVEEGFIHCFPLKSVILPPDSYCSVLLTKEQPLIVRIFVDYIRVYVESISIRIPIYTWAWYVLPLCLRRFHKTERKQLLLTSSSTKKGPRTAGGYTSKGDTAISRQRAHLSLVVSVHAIYIATWGRKNQNKAERYMDDRKTKNMRA